MRSLLPIPQQNTLVEILSQAKTDNLIRSEELDFLVPRSPRIATFYSLPNVHKGTQPVKGRPIVSGIQSLTQNLGICVDEILSPFPHMSGTPWTSHKDWMVYWWIPITGWLALRWKVFTHLSLIRMVYTQWSICYHEVDRTGPTADLP